MITPYRHGQRSNGQLRAEMDSQVDRERCRDAVRRDFYRCQQPYGYEGECYCPLFWALRRMGEPAARPTRY